MKFRVTLFLLTFIFLFSVFALAHEKVVVVPLGGKGYEPQNPLVIPAADFRGDSGGAAYYYVFSQGYAYGSSASSAGCMMAPVYVPNDVTITKFTAMVYDNNTSYALGVYLRRRPIDNLTLTSSLLASVSASDSTSPQTLEDTTISNALVDTANYVYYAHICLYDSTHRLYAVKIHYQK